MQNIQLGTDVEFFLTKKHTGEVISGEGIVRGTKDNPANLGEPGYKVSLDNVLIEGNIPPIETKEEWLSSIEKLYNYLANEVPDDVALQAKASNRMEEKYINTDHARLFGCSVSWIAWTKMLKRNPDPAEIGNLRSAGFHVHASWDGGYDWDEQLLFIKAMDYHVGVPSVLIDTDNERRTMYGKAGEFRTGLTYPGCEYRTLSSFFAGSNELRGWVFDNTLKAIEAVNAQKLDFLNYGDDIQTAINTGDRGIASALIAADL
jgi:hypothetical protein